MKSNKFLDRRNLFFTSPCLQSSESIVVPKNEFCTTIEDTAVEIYSHELDAVHQVLSEIQLALVRRTNLAPLHDFVRPHVSKAAVAKLNQTEKCISPNH